MLMELDRRNVALNKRNKESNNVGSEMDRRDLNAMLDNLRVWPSKTMDRGNSEELLRLMPVGTYVGECDDDGDDDEWKKCYCSY